jgi:hypothetical protein
MLETLLTPERWAALVRLNVRSSSDTVKPIRSAENGFLSENTIHISRAILSLAADSKALSA